MAKSNSKKAMAAASAPAYRDTLPRTVLPIPDQPYAGPVLYDAKNPEAKFEPIQRLLPPNGAPNVLIVLLDDVGFGASSAFGGPVHTPTAERLAAEGLKYTRFHTTAICSPTRAALMTGRNHHSVGMGGITEMATAAPGYTSVRPNTCGTIAEIVKMNGYATAHFGKCHEVPVWETSPAGPFDRWPSPGNGFEHFYGFVGGETDQWYPTLLKGTTAVDPWGTPEEGYHLTEDLADNAIGWIRQQKALVPDKPFFVYFAPGATHAPHQVPKEWADKYKGKFDDGWDEQRERTFARQKELGVIPQDAELTQRHNEIPAWNEMPDDLKPILRRQMENYAGFLENADHHVGRVIDAIEQLGLLEDTLVYLIIGDNGASAEGTIKGTFNELISLNGMSEIETPEFLNSRLESWGGPESSPHYAVGWAHAMCTPYQWTKQVASHWGGTRNGTIVHWPNGFEAKGELRNQFHHVIDVAPTVLEAARLPQPFQVNGINQKPIEGVSMLYSFDDGEAEERHHTQYFEIFGNRGVYHRGWSAITKHRTPWQTTGDVGIAFDDDRWELYDGSKDWTQAHDLSRENPAKLEELKKLFMIEAARYNVLPLDDRSFERVLPAIAGRPAFIQRDKQILLPGMGGMMEQHVLDWRNRSWSLTADIRIDNDATGVLFNLGGNMGGWSYYLKEGRPSFCYNLFGIQETIIRADKLVKAGDHQIRIEFAYDGGGLGKGGTLTHYIDGKEVGSGRLERTEPIGFGTEYTQIGRDIQSPVTKDYTPGDNSFSGTINFIELASGSDSHDHLVDHEQLLNYFMAKQ